MTEDKTVESQAQPVPGVEALAAVDDVFAQHHARGLEPGLGYGVVAGGGLLHARGLGSLWPEGAAVETDSVFRICSLTKSFAAAALLRLRDQGALSLEDPVARYVPHVAGLALPTADSPPLTLRTLLTMSSGLPTDDAWADRLLPLTPDGFDVLLREGFRFAWPPGTRFEYSNLGWGMLGRVLTVVSGVGFAQFMTDAVLRPLGLTATTFSAADLDPGRLALGHERREGRWQALPFAGHGEFSAMGGLYSSVRDLGRWVTWLVDAFPARDEPDEDPILSRATRREMQQAHRAMEPPLDFPAPENLVDVPAGGYGYGLFVVQHRRHGTVVGHPGGLPGFGASLLWHPASGLGVVVLANGTYSPVHDIALAALDALVSASPAASGQIEPWPETEAAREAVLRLLDDWDDGLARGLFAPNVELDLPLADRRAEAERLRKELGGLEPDPTVPPHVVSPAAVTWWMRAPRGTVKVELQMTPERAPRVQKLTLTPEPRRASPGDGRPGDGP